MTNIVDSLGQPIDIPKINEVAVEDIPIEKRGLQLPEIKGYKLLCAIPEAADAYESGILKAGDAKRIEENYGIDADDIVDLPKRYFYYSSVNNTYEKPFTLSEK